LNIQDIIKHTYENEPGEIRVRIWEKVVFDVVKYLLTKILGEKIYQQVSTVAIILATIVTIGLVGLLVFFLMAFHGYKGG
jgi:hypothetical protein